ncbi:uncharacterized protein LOC144448694 [Glandiceps talaboti]
MNSIIKDRSSSGFDPRRNAGSGMESTQGFSGLPPRLYEAVFRKAQHHSTSVTTPNHPTNPTPVGNVISERERERLRTSTRMQFVEGNAVVPTTPGSTTTSRSSSPSSTTSTQGQYTGPGIWCENCNTRLVKLKRQALRLMLPTILNGTLTGKEHEISATLHDKLQVPDSSQKWADNRCEVCATHLSQLKQEAVAMVQSLERAQSSGDTSSLSNIPALIGSCNLASLQRCLYMYHSHDKSSGHSRQRQTKGVFNNPSSVSSPVPVPAMQLAAQAQQYLEGDNTVQAGSVWSNQQPSALISHYQAPQSSVGSSKSSVVSDISLTRSLPQYGLSKSPPMSSNASTASSTSAAASFFARAAQKLNLTSKKKKKQTCLASEPANPEPPIFPTNFGDIILKNPPGAPPCLLKGGRRENPGMGKVKVMLRVCPSPHQYEGGSFLTIDPRKKQVTIYDPTFLNNGYVTPAHRRAGIVAPKMFAFDAIFSQDASQAEICAGSVADIVQSVVNGADGCLFCYGHARLGKTYTMIGKDDSPQNLGIIPCAISWLFKIINDRKERSGARFSVRVSAVEVVGKSENLKDLLAEQAMGSANGVGTAPGIYLREDPICGVQLHNQSELRAPTPEKAAFYLDAALAARSQRTSDGDPEEEAKNSHLLFTLHIYQYRVDKSGKGGVAGGRSRLHLIDLGCEKLGKTNGSGSGLSLSALGNVILALVNGAKHVPYKDSKVTQLLKESLGNLSCRTTMIAHVSGAMNFHSETLSTVQLASRIHRMRKKKSRYSSTSSSGGESSCDEGRVRRPHIRALHPRNPPGTVPENAPITNALTFSDPEYISSSEQSCDTVIYCGPDGVALSDRELTDNEGVPEVVPIIRSTVAKPPAFKSNLRQTYSPEVRRKNSGSRGSDGESGKKSSLLTCRSAENSPEIRRKNMSVQNAEFICEFGPETARKLDANIVTERRVLCEFGPATARKADEIPNDKSAVVIHEFGPAIARQKDTASVSGAVLCEFGPETGRKVDELGNLCHSDPETTRKTDNARTSHNDSPQHVPDKRVNSPRSRATEKKLSGIPTPVHTNLPKPKTRDNNSTSPERSQSPNNQAKLASKTKSTPSNKNTTDKQSFLPTPNKGVPTKQKKTPPPPPPRMQYKPTPIKTKAVVQNEKSDAVVTQTERTEPQGEKVESLPTELPTSSSKSSDHKPSSSPWRRISVQNDKELQNVEKLEERTEPVGMSTANEQNVIRGNDKVNDCYFVPIPRSEAQERRQAFEPCISDRPEEFCRSDYDILDHQQTPRQFQGDSTISLEVNPPDLCDKQMDDYDINDEEIEQCMMKQAEAIREMALNDFLPTLNPGYSMEVVGAGNDPEDQLQSPSETPMVDLLTKTLDQMMASAHMTGFSSSELPLSADAEVADMIGDSFEHPMQSVSQASYDDEDDMESVSMDTSLIPDEPSSSMYLSVDMFKRQLWDRCIQETKYQDDDDDFKLDDIDDSGSEDHPLRPLSMLSVDSDNTFTTGTNSRPMSYMTLSLEKTNHINEMSKRLQLDVKRQQPAKERIPTSVNPAKKEINTVKKDSVASEGKDTSEPVWQRRQSCAVEEEVEHPQHTFEQVDQNEQLLQAQSPTDSNMCNTTNSGIPTLRSLISKGGNVNTTGAYIKDNCIPGSFKFVSPPTSPSRKPASPSRTLQVSEIPKLSSQCMAEPIYGDERWSPKHSPRHNVTQPMPDLLMSSPKRDPSPSKLEPIQFTIEEKANQAPSWRKETRLWHAEGKSDPDISDIAEMKANLQNEFVPPLSITIVGMATSTKYSPVLSDSEEPPSWLSRQPDGACDPPEAVKETKSIVTNGKSNHVLRRKELNGKPDGYASDSCCRAIRQSPTKTLSPAYSVCSCCSNKEDINGNIQQLHATAPAKGDNSRVPNVQRKHPSAKASLTSKTSKPVVPPKPARPNVPPKPKATVKPRPHNKQQDNGSGAQTLADIMRNKSPPRKHNLETASLRSASSASSRSSSKLPIRSSSTTAVNLLSSNTGSSKSKNSKLPLPSGKLTKNSSTTSSKSSMQSVRNVPPSKLSQTNNKPSQTTGKSMQSMSSRSTSKNSSTVGKTSSGSSKIPQSGNKSSSNSLSSSSKAVSKSAPSLAKSSSAKSQQINSKTIKTSTEQSSAKTIRHTDSDSGNDSGIAGAESTPTKNKSRFLSPYSTVTKPRMTSRCSSGHGSDNSSTISETIGFVGSKTASPCTGGTSSGYESMLRDSEATASTSSTHDSLSESSSGRIKGVKMLKKKLSQGSRSRRSGPPRPSDSPSAVRKSSPGRWVDLRPKSPNEAVELKVYEVDDIEKVNRIRSEEGESMAYFSAKLAAIEMRQENVATLKNKQQQLKEELASTKAKLMIDSSEWNFNVNVLEEMDPDTPNYVDALERENEQLAKRLAVCKSHVMMVTCFDSN